MSQEAAEGQNKNNLHNRVPVYIFYAISMNGGDAVLEAYATEEAARFRARQYVNQTFARSLREWILDYGEAVTYAALEQRERVGVVERQVEIF
jgi:hypothetical protein